MQTVENEELKNKNQEMISEIKMDEISANIQSESGDVEKNSQIEYLGIQTFRKSQWKFKIF